MYGQWYDLDEAVLSTVRKLKYLLHRIYDDQHDDSEEEGSEEEGSEEEGSEEEGSGEEGPEAEGEREDIFAVYCVDCTV